MSQDLFEWLLLVVRWAHITTAIVWIGESIFFMWLDRSLEPVKEPKKEGHVGELWMVHGGGFYQVEKMLMGPTKVPEHLHWFKWESYWTWMTGSALVFLIFYTGDGTYLLDSNVSQISYFTAIGIGLFSVFGSWFFYDFLWERKLTKNKPIIGHVLTILWLIGMTYFLCHTLSGRAAYIHIAGMLGTWMTANVFLRIIPRQAKMVEASKKGEAVNQDWGKNAKNRSTHNTYFTLPVIFLMLSNHFPMTYGSTNNWMILLLVTAGGACIREYFVTRIQKPSRSKIFGLIGVLIIASTIFWTSRPAEMKSETATESVQKKTSEAFSGTTGNIQGTVFFEGEIPKPIKLSVPATCAKEYSGQAYSNEVLVQDGKLQNVVIRIVKGLEGKSFPDSGFVEPVLLDQRGCQYSPRIVSARIGQKVIVQNSDVEFHNVHYISEKEGEKNVSQPAKGIKTPFTFNEPQLVKFKCDLHPWMYAYAVISDDPYCVVSNESGEFLLKNIPLGTYTIEAWHEVFGKQIQEISVTEENKNNVTLNFTFKKAN